MKKTALIHNSAIGLTISLILCLTCGLMSNLAQTDGGHVTKETLQIESPSGHRLSMDMLQPKTASPEHPAPAIVFAHGGNTNKEKSDDFQIEWARRGFVVVSFDLYGHGESEILNDQEWLVNGRGLYDTVEYLTSLPFVDADRIGVSGHSRGGNTIHESILIDNKRRHPLIKTVLYVSRDPVYRDNETAAFGYVPGKTNVVEAARKNTNGKYFNYYRERTVGVLAGKYDDYSFKEKDTSTGKIKPNPQYLKSNNARSFLNFGITPTDQTPAGISGRWYHKQINGHQASHVIYMENGTHGTVLFLSRPCTDAVQFMVQAFNMKTGLADGDHIYPVKMIGGLLGLIGLMLFMVYGTLCLVRTNLFKKAGSEEPARMRQADANKGGSVWLWVCLLSATAFSVASALTLFGLKVDKHIGNYFRQGMPLFYGVWGCLNAVFMIGLTILWYRMYARRRGIKVSDLDLPISGGRLWQTIKLALTVSLLAILLIFTCKFLFNSDFRFWYWAARPFTADKIPEMLKLLPFFLVAYGTTSVFINSLNYSTSFGRSPAANIGLLAFFDMLPALLIAVTGYGYFFATGVNGLFGNSTQIPDWMLTPLVPLAVMPLVTRAIYRHTRNPYLGGIITAIIVTIMTCINSQISFPA